LENGNVPAVIEATQYTQSKLTFDAELAAFVLQRAAGGLDLSL
jgi:hypothetical protein